MWAALQPAGQPYSPRICNNPPVRAAVGCAAAVCGTHIVLPLQLAAGWSCEQRRLCSAHIVLKDESHRWQNDPPRPSAAEGHGRILFCILVFTAVGVGVHRVVCLTFCSGFVCNILIVPVLKSVVRFAMVRQHHQEAFDKHGPNNILNTLHLNMPLMMSNKYEKNLTQLIAPNSSITYINWLASLRQDTLFLSFQRLLPELVPCLLQQ